MHIVLKRVRVIVMAPEELASFRVLMDQTAQDQTANYAEKQLSDGTFLGVAVQPKEVVEAARRTQIERASLLRAFKSGRIDKEYYERELERLGEEGSK